VASVAQHDGRLGQVESPWRCWGGWWLGRALFSGAWSAMVARLSVTWPLTTVVESIDQHGKALEARGVLMTQAVHASCECLSRRS
jgi:hypothetical protein